MMELGREKNKRVESYPRVSRANSHKTTKEKDKRSTSTRKRWDRKKILQHYIAKKTMESKKAHIKNLSDYACDKINLMSRGLNSIPT